MPTDSPDSGSCNESSNEGDGDFGSSMSVQLSLTSSCMLASLSSVTVFFLLSSATFGLNVGSEILKMASLGSSTNYM